MNTSIWDNSVFGTSLVTSNGKLGIPFYDPRAPTWKNKSRFRKYNGTIQTQFQKRNWWGWYCIQRCLRMAFVVLGSHFGFVIIYSYLQKLNHESHKEYKYRFVSGIIFSLVFLEKSILCNSTDARSALQSLLCPRCWYVYRGTLQKRRDSVEFFCFIIYYYRYL